MHDLVERARRGDHDAFSALVDGSVGRLYAVACLILRDRDRAHDAVQEAFVVAWRDIRALRDPDRVDAWFRRLVVRACYRQARADRRRTVVELRVVEDMPPVTPGPELTVVDRDRLERGFSRLGSDHRTILVLTHYLGLPLTEVAATLGIPIGTAKSRLNRALAAMRAAIDADDRPNLVEEGRTA
ncbi:MAG TPA: RNA polymerase sigma factor [Candidatus Limnocylindrales bacterium]|nr:RNA polymerase sigma factor [Candidatus Limnocylindrales bacterium]